MKKPDLKKVIKEEIISILSEARFEKGTDIGKKGKGFSKIAKSAAKEYGSEEAGKRVAGAILKKVLNKENAPAIEKEKTKTKEKEETKPKRRTLSPPKESPNTKPKALMEKKEDELVSKIAQRFKKLNK